VSDETYDLYQQGRAHLRKGQAAQATVALEKAKRREPQKTSIREALGIAYLRIERYPEAEEEFRALLELSPADHYAHYALGRALEKQGKESEANGHYKLASSLRPQNEHYASRILDLDHDEGEDAGDGSAADDPAR
jgi:Flp pilus assembly protein TadD